MGGVLRGDPGLPENGEVCFELLKDLTTYFVYSLKMNWTHFAQKKGTSGKGRASGSYFVFINFGFVGLVHLRTRTCNSGKR